MFFQSIDHFQGNPWISIVMLVYCRVTVVMSDCGWSHCFKSTPWRSETIFQMVFGKDYFIAHRIHVCYIYMVTCTINIPQMLAYIYIYIYIYHTWILWVLIPSISGFPFFIMLGHQKNGSNLHPCYDPPRLSSGRRRRRTRRWGKVNWGWEESLAPSPTDPHCGWKKSESPVDRW